MATKMLIRTSECKYRVAFIIRVIFFLGIPSMYYILTSNAENKQLNNISPGKVCSLKGSFYLFP